MEIKGLEDLIVASDIKIDPATITGKRLCDVEIGHIISASSVAQTSGSSTRVRPATSRPTPVTRLEEITDGSDFI